MIVHNPLKSIFIIKYEILCIIWWGPAWFPGPAIHYEVVYCSSKSLSPLTCNNVLPCKSPSQIANLSTYNNTSQKKIRLTSIRTERIQKCKSGESVPLDRPHAWYGQSTGTDFPKRISARILCCCNAKSHVIYMYHQEINPKLV